LVLEVTHVERWLSFPAFASHNFHRSAIELELDFPQGVSGLVLEVLEEKTALWHVFDTEEGVKYLGQVSTNHICE
jgi:hypothetical protein